MKNCYLELDFNAILTAPGNNWFAVGDYIRWVILGPVAIFNIYRLTKMVEKKERKWQRLIYLFKV